MKPFALVSVPILKYDINIREDEFFRLAASKESL